MTLQEITFDGAEVTSYDDALIRHEHLLVSSAGYRDNYNGIALNQGDIWGYVSYSNNEIVIGTGTAVVYGRQFKNGAPESVAIEPATSTRYGKVFVHINLSNPMNDQINFSTQYSSTGYPEIIKGNVLEGEEYGFELCTFIQDSSGITTISNINQAILSQESPGLFAKINGKTTSHDNSWWRIAISPVDIMRCSGSFKIKWATSSVYGVAIFEASSMYGTTNAMTQTLYETYVIGANNIIKARIVYHTNHPGNFAYLEILNGNGGAMNVEISMENGDGWELLPPTSDGNLVVGTVPPSYAYKELVFVTGVSTNGEIRINNSRVITENQYSPNIAGYKVDIAPGYLISSTNDQYGLVSFFHFWNSSAGDWMEMRTPGDMVYGVAISQSVTFETDVLANVNNNAIYENNKTATEQILEMTPCQINTENTTVKNTFDPYQLKTINPDLVLGKEEDSLFINQRAIIDMLILMNQEQQKQIDELKAKIT